MHSIQPPPLAYPVRRRIYLRLPNRWAVGVVLIAAVVAGPVLAVMAIALQSSQGLWAHLASTVLAGYVLNTLGLALGVGVGVVVIGVGTAWLVTMCRFPGRWVFQWALLLPLAMPTYLAAYAYTDLLEFAGPIQGGMRALFGWQSKAEYWFPEVRSLGGAIAFMTLVLYPYVYLLCRASLLEQSVGVLEAGRSLGHGPWRSFCSVALPLARPAIVIGVLLAVMESLNDFGTVEYFGVPTFTVGIYRVWFGMNNAPAAAQLATVLLTFVIVLIWLERTARRSRRFHTASGKGRPLPGYELRAPLAGLAFAACLAPILLGFLVPGGVLLRYSLATLGKSLHVGLATTMANSLLVSSLAATTAIAVGLSMAYGLRLGSGGLVRAATRIASIGYAVPGAVLAIGVLIPATRLDNAVDAFMRDAFGISTGLLLSGTVAALTFAYVVRFLALSFGTLEASLTKITPRMDDAARSLGSRPAATLWRVHLPLMRGSVLTAGMLVFVDGMKELPMTLMLRPFNFDTLATYVYERVSYELFPEAAPAALAIVLAGLLPVIVLSRSIAGARPGAAAAGPRSVSRGAG